MADPSLSTGVTIPGSTRRPKAYSVSLHDNVYDVSEVSPEDHNHSAVTDDDGQQHADSNQRDSKIATCRSCGQLLPAALRNGRPWLMADSAGQLSRSLPAQFGTNLTQRNYEAVNDSGRSSQTDGLEHCHGKRNSQPDVRAKRSLITASVLCLIFMVGEVIGGYLANSLAIATDAAHLLTDFASFMISLFSLWLASRPPTKSMSFGWYRAEVIGALISVLMIWVVTGVLVYLAIQRLVSKEFDIDANVMLITSGIGVAVNFLMGFTLHQHGHSHSHGHSHNRSEHQHLLSSSEDLESQPLITHGHSHESNINVRAAFIHVVGDLIQSLGVFIAALVIYFKPDLTVIDPICTFLFSIIVLFTTVAILKDALTVLMEGLPRGLDFNNVQETFLSINGVVRVHNLRIWALSMDKIALAAHLAVRPGVKTQEVLLQASKLARSRFNVFEMTLQIEEFESGMEDCTQCQDPAD